MKLIDVVQRLKLLNDYDQCKDAMNEAITEIESLRKANTELQASNNRLREALVICKQFITEAILDDNYHEASCGLDEIYNLRDKAIKLSEAALSATPAESLRAHDDEVIEKCAKVCEGGNFLTESSPEYMFAKSAAKAIRAIKSEVK